MKYVNWLLFGVFVGALAILYLASVDPLHIGHGTHTADLR
jgi:hypothetical protein